MANEQNLKPLNKRTKSEQREIAKKGRQSESENQEKPKNLYEKIWNLY